MSTVRQDTLLDTQKGGLVTVAVAPAGSESLVFDGEPTPARRFKMTGDVNLTLWYGPKNELVRMAFEARGSDIDYERWPKAGETRSTISP